MAITIEAGKFYIADKNQIFFAISSEELVLTEENPSLKGLYQVINKGDDVLDDHYATKDIIDNIQPINNRYHVGYMIRHVAYKWIIVSPVLWKEDNYILPDSTDVLYETATFASIQKLVENYMSNPTYIENISLQGVGSYIRLEDSIQFRETIFNIQYPFDD